MGNYWTIQEASEATGYNEAYLRRLCRNGKIEAVQRGNTWFVKIRSLRVYRKTMQKDVRGGARWKELPL